MICATCAKPVRPFVTPIPEGADVTFAEAVAGCVLYCQACFDAMEAPQ